MDDAKLKELREIAISGDLFHSEPVLELLDEIDRQAEMIKVLKSISAYAQHTPAICHWIESEDRYSCKCGLTMKLAKFKAIVGET